MAVRAPVDEVADAQHHVPLAKFEFVEQGFEGLPAPVDIADNPDRVSRIEGCLKGCLQLGVPVGASHATPPCDQAATGCGR